MKCDGRSSNEWWLAPIGKGHVSCCVGVAVLCAVVNVVVIARAESPFEHGRDVRRQPRDARVGQGRHVKLGAIAFRLLRLQTKPLKN